MSTSAQRCAGGHGAPDAPHHGRRGACPAPRRGPAAFPLPPSGGRERPGADRPLAGGAARWPHTSARALRFLPPPTPRRRCADRPGRRCHDTALRTCPRSPRAPHADPTTSHAPCPEPARPGQHHARAPPPEYGRGPGGRPRAQPLPRAHDALCQRHRYAPVARRATLRFLAWSGPHTGERRRPGAAAPHHANPPPYRPSLPYGGPVRAARRRRLRGLFPAGAGARGTSPGPRRHRAQEGPDGVAPAHRACPLLGHRGHRIFPACPCARPAVRTEESRQTW